MACGLGIRGTVEAGLLLRQRAVSPCRRLPHVKADALSAHTSDSRPPQDGANGAAESASVAGVGAVALVLFALRQIRRARTGEVLLDLRPLAVRGFTLPIIVLLILFGAMLGVMNTLPLNLQGSLLAAALVDGANSAFLTSAGLVGIALVLSLFIRAPRSGSRTEIEG